MIILKILFLFLTFDVLSALMKDEYFYKTLKFEVPLDHFTFSNNRTFHIRYLLNDTFWDENEGPIFFYTGNEGYIELFANHTGFMWEIANEFKALLVFAEHRYYGTSLPFGDKSLTPENLGYLTSSQALADYVDLITSLQKKAPGNRRPVIAFGGSYGGMLAAYIRMKYPHIVNGAIAASAPVHYFTGMVPCDTFYRVTTSAYTSERKTCASNIKKAWSQLRSTASTQKGKDWINKEWKLCTNIKADNDTDALLEYLSNVYVTLAQSNYPYETNFVAKLPANPLKQFCNYLKNDSLTGEPLLRALYSALNVYTNYTGDTKCLDYMGDYDGPFLGDEAWSYQSCTEMVFPMCSDGIHDMFEKSDWNEKRFTENCRKKYGVDPDYYMAEKLYGGDRIQAASNIVFSNGLMDPWAGGGLLKNYSALTYAILMPEAAHHLDLMAADARDPYSVRFARNFHKYYIKQWIKENRTA